MILMEIGTILPYPIEDVSALTIDLQKAPHWHSIFRNVTQLTPNPIGIESHWQIHYVTGRFELEITDYQPPHRVTFKGSRVTGGTVPNFTIELQTESEGT